MKISKVAAFIMSLLVSMSAAAQFRNGSAYEDLYDSETSAALKEHVRMLSSSMMEGRGAGTEGERLAAEYVTEQFEKYGLDVLTPKEGDVFGVVTEKGDTLQSRNVVAYVRGYDKSLDDNIIVVGARMDNLGMMPMTVDGQQTYKTFYGANGNASGLSILLELARMVEMNRIMFRRPVVFVAFGASCETFAGAWYFVNRSFEKIWTVDAMINLDMLGTGYNGFYAYTSSNADMNSILRTLAGSLQPIVPEIVAAEPYPSDHRVFYAKEIPSVMFTTGRYPEHNTEKDTESIIDYAYMERELEYIYNAALALAGWNGQIAFRPDAAPKRKGPANRDVVSYADCDYKPMFLNSSDPKQFLEKWVYQYLKYPQEAVRDGIQGRVMVEFIIGIDGKVTDVQVVRSVSPELDAEAVKVVSASPKWKPARLKGEKVRCSMTIPVEFRLEKRGKSSFGIKK
ncbi:MAG: TonB family protein [Bacteroidales bacterium]|nr:TonB family protein [Bacteroidales bacterium]MBR5862639.1 TonB family protein [Bacteroidales bacterium]